MGASGIGLEGLAPGGSGGAGAEVTLFEVVADAGFLSVDLDLPAPPPPAPSTLSNRGCFGVRRWEGRRERALPHYFSPQVLFHSRARALTQVSTVGPHPPGPVSVR